MALTHFACANCGFWQLHFDPPDCPVCTDVRNDLPEDGWRFVPEAEIAATHEGEVREVAEGLWAFTTTPALGLAGTGWLLTRPKGNVAFEAAPYYSRAMLDRIAQLGGIAALAASHPHGYGALFQLQRAFEPPVVAIHKDDLAYTKAFAVTAPYDDTLELAPGFTLHHVGGHYAGQAALLRRAGPAAVRGRHVQGRSGRGRPQHASLGAQGVPQEHPADPWRACTLPRGDRAAGVRRGVDPVRICARSRPGGGAGDARRRAVAAAAGAKVRAVSGLPSDLP